MNLLAFLRLPALPEDLVWRLRELVGALPRRTLTLAGAGLLGAVLLGVGAYAAVASNDPGARALERFTALAQRFGGDYSDASLARLVAEMDPAMQRLARRFDPLLMRKAKLDALAQANVAFEAPPEFTLQNVDPNQAMLLNASVPYSLLPNPAAQPLVLRTSTPEDYAQAVTCLTAAVYYEAAIESDEGQAAVAQVVLNRMRHPLFPKTVCGVVFQGSNLKTGCQFTFTCDGALTREPNLAGWARARVTAERALNGFVLKSVGNATHYHTDWVFPYWAPSLVKLTKIGTHIFYRWSGSGGLPGAFNGAYAGDEGAAWLTAGPKLVRVTLSTLLEDSPSVAAPVEVFEPPPAEMAVVVVAAAPVEVAAPAALEAEAPPADMVVQPPVFQTGLRREPRPQPRIAVPSNW